MKDKFSLDRPKDKKRKKDKRVLIFFFVAITIIFLFIFAKVWKEAGSFKGHLVTIAIVGVILYGGILWILYRKQKRYKDH
jgi:heme/copper-type cytochrome/quinol oxidase subunit 4